MHRNRREHGEGKLGCLVGLALLVIAIFIAYKMIPVKVRAAEVRQVVQDEAKEASIHNDDQIRAAILRKAHDDSLPITEENIKITRGPGDIAIDVNYVVPIDFPGYTYQWHIQHFYSNPIF